MNSCTKDVLGIFDVDEKNANWKSYTALCFSCKLRQRLVSPFSLAPYDVFKDHTDDLQTFWPDVSQQQQKTTTTFTY